MALEGTDRLDGVAYDAGGRHLDLLPSIAGRHPGRAVAKYCRRLSRGVRPTRKADLDNVAMLCAWEHAFGEYGDVLGVAALADGYEYAGSSTWGPMRWVYGLVADVHRRLGEPGRAEELAAAIMEHENPNFYPNSPLFRDYYTGNAESARREGRRAAMVGWQLHQYCELVFCSVLPGFPTPPGELLAQAADLAAVLCSEAGG